mmetsp:Transcript_7164/g.9304  ORF Transcript_7164/g.9304 Transcript_7164/m.9304 type:complete len:221 (-) Transcript_7164:194-856(-)
MSTLKALRILHRCSSRSNRLAAAPFVSRIGTAAVPAENLFCEIRVSRSRCFSTAVAGSADVVSSSAEANALEDTSNQFHWNSEMDDLFDPSAPCLVYGSATRIPRPPSKVMECGVEEDDLRYKTTNYEKLLKPPYIHPNEHKVVLHVTLEDLTLDEIGHEILKQAVGHNRYDLRKKELRLQCNHFASRIENKRYLVQTLDKLILSCQRLAKDLPKSDATA